MPTQISQALQSLLFMTPTCWLYIQTEGQAVKVKRIYDIVPLLEPTEEGIIEEALNSS